MVSDNPGFDTQKAHPGEPLLNTIPLIWYDTVWYYDVSSLVDGFV